MKPVGRALKGLRLSKGIGLREFARTLNISPSGITNLESDSSNPSWSSIERHLSALDATVLDLAEAFGHAPPAAPKEEKRGSGEPEYRFVPVDLDSLVDLVADRLAGRSIAQRSGRDSAMSSEEERSIEDTYRKTLEEDDQRTG